jgi:ABC-type nitrate/sulfonate/bicarbonate transport system substrate-binding protein
MIARRIARPLLLALAAAIGCGAPGADAQEKIKIGYWTSGFSVGFGAVLEAGKFVEQQGLVPEYIRFAEVNAPTKAILTQSIDVAFAAPTSGAFTLGIQGAPIEIALATQIAEATFVTKEGSPIKSITDSRARSSACRRWAAPPMRSPRRCWKGISGSSPRTTRRSAATRRNS